MFTSLILLLLFSFSFSQTNVSFLFSFHKELHRLVSQINTDPVLFGTKFFTNASIMRMSIPMIDCTALKMLYLFFCFLPHLHYATFAWELAASTKLDRLFKIQKDW